MVADWTSKHDKHEAMQLLGAAGIPAGAVLDTKELTEDATFAQRGILQIDGASRWSRDYRMPAWPVRHNGSAAGGASRRRCWASTPARCSTAWLGLERSATSQASGRTR